VRLTATNTEHRRTTGSIGDIFVVLLFVGLLARHHAAEDFSDRVELGGVDERIGAHVEKFAQK